MERRPIWHAARMQAVGVALAIALSLLSGALPGAGAPIVEAGVAQGKDDDKKDKKERDRNQDEDEDHTLNGQVLEVNTDKVPPEMIVGTIDGEALVRVLKTDEIALNGVKVGDYVELNGEKLDELLFEATAISVDHTAN
jgi:ribosomal protein L12E/L44/L45/RPP1/RPP2